MKPLLTLLIASFAISLFAESDDAALAFLKQHAGDIYTKITSLRDRDPDDYRDAMDDAQKAAADYAKIEATGDTAVAVAYVKMYHLDFQAITLSDQIIATTDKVEQQRLTQQLRELISQSFEQWIIVEQARVKRLEGELADVKAKLDHTLHDRAKAVDEDTAKLIEETRAYQAKKKMK